MKSTRRSTPSLTDSARRDGRDVAKKMRSVVQNDVARRCEDARRSNALADWVDAGAEVDLSTRHTSLWVVEPARPPGRQAAAAAR